MHYLSISQGVQATCKIEKEDSTRSLVGLSGKLCQFFGFQVGAAGETRTPDTLVRSQVLYPTELRPHEFKDLGKV